MDTKVKLLLLILISFLNCKENHDTVKTQIETVQRHPDTIAELPAIIRDLVKFAEPTFSDSVNINEMLSFKAIDGNGMLSPIEMDRAVTLYKRMTKHGPVSSRPIFEIKKTDMAILPVQGIGFGGAIWANVLVDKKTLEIIKVAFEHKAESDGYGAAMTQSTFENQFIGIKINLDQNTFDLQKEIEKTKDNGIIIEGISGATVTSQGAVEMMNEGLRKYRGYLEEN